MKFMSSRPISPSPSNQVWFDCPGVQTLRRIVMTQLAGDNYGDNEKSQAVTMPMTMAVKKTCSLRSFTRAKSFASPGLHLVELRKVSTLKN